ncbi:neprilysin-2-like isoform X2 [Dermacentor variabilis]|uniref:neprilysin-2-like isoform X2 n=1 Tax=Dermacentor variabilis TaxID=34621 RepID=UPI003F5ADE94
MSAAKTRVDVCTTTSKFLQAAVLLLWVLWIIFGYRSNLILRHAERKQVEVLHPDVRTTAPEFNESVESTTIKAEKTRTTGPASKDRTRSSKFRDICWKPQCIALADIISDGLGKSRPCDDFYGYMCGQRAENKVLPPSNVRSSAIKALQEILKYPKIRGQQSSSAAGKFTAAYRSCVNTRNDSLRLQVSLQRILRELGFKDWPKTSKDSPGESHETIDDTLKKMGLRTFFDYYVQPQSKHAASEPTIIITKRTNFFFVSSVSTEKNLFSEIPNSKKAGRAVSTSENITAEQYGRYKDFIAETIKLIRANVTEEESALMADDILTFEQEVAKISDGANLKRIEINATSVGTEASSANFTLRTMLQEELGVINATLDDGIRIILEYPDYYTALRKFMSSVNNTNVVKNYVIWSYLRSLAEAEGTALHDLYLTYKLNATNTARSSASNHVAASCIKQLLKPDAMLSAGASLYIKNSFDKYDRNNVQKMMHFVKASFRKIIAENKWMTDSMKTKAAQRLAKMEMVIGYPDWMLDNLAVNELYEFVPLLSENLSFAEYIFWIQENHRYQELLKLGPQYKEKEFSAVAFFPHPYYVERSDTLVLPAAVIVPHYRRPPMPRALNFGTVGTLASMLMVNAIDRFDTIRTTDYKGGFGGKIVTKEFWDEDTKRRFCQYSGCLKNEECKDSEKYVKAHGEAHLNDYVGVRVSFMALKDSVGNYTKPYFLPGGNFDTEDKIFFLSFGNLFCPFGITKAFPTGRSREPIRTQRRRSYRARLNSAVNGYYGFLKAFKCKGTMDVCKLFPQTVDNLNSE